MLCQSLVFCVNLVVCVRLVTVHHNSAFSGCVQPCLPMISAGSTKGPYLHLAKGPLQKVHKAQASKAVQFGNVHVDLLWTFLHLRCHMCETLHAFKGVPGNQFQRCAWESCSRHTFDAARCKHHLAFAVFRSSEPSCTEVLPLPCCILRTNANTTTPTCGHRAII